ncbi:MAG: UDP-N-acetylglucosamine 2-epimerase (non-hydrolyzing) [Bacteroidales bacterium]|nr:UDP-N-acetylglucosamine 2-epimerase (non-hydrolyzing) [Bacteroidales bacterium]
MIKLLTIVGARPQFIKAAALSRVIREEFSHEIREVILHTGQHYDASMSEVFFREMQIPEPAYNLDIGSLSHGSQTGLMIQGIEDVILNEKPDGVIAYGDTNSTLAGALASAKLQIPVIHIEAGLRSFNKQMPEEINRITCDHVSTLLFSPTCTGVENLAKEGIMHSDLQPYTFDHQGVFHSGDIMYDNTLFFRELARNKPALLRELELEEKPYILATVHRPSNTDVTKNLQNIITALHGISRENQIPVIVPLHPRTAGIIENLKAQKALEPDDPSGMVHFIPAVSFLDMISLEAGASVILTDSGGVQKEAWFMEKPVVVLREETEWVEIIESGNGRLAGSSVNGIMEATRDFLDTPPASYPPIFGEGHSAREILKVLTTTRWR